MPYIYTVNSSAALPYVPDYLTGNHTNSYDEEENPQRRKKDVALNVNCSSDSDSGHYQSARHREIENQNALASLHSGQVRYNLVNGISFRKILDINSFFPQRVLHVIQTTSI
tara:strand:- start:621 stop:956 length:336 start_codon:yes stop_codon:yes gene_type:complete